MSLHHHRGAVADENSVNWTLRQETGKRVVVTRHHRKLAALGFCAEKVHVVHGSPRRGRRWQAAPSEGRATPNPPDCGSDTLPTARSQYIRVWLGSFRPSSAACARMCVSTPVRLRIRGPKLSVKASRD